LFHQQQHKHNHVIVAYAVIQTVSRPSAGLAHSHRHHHHLMVLLLLLAHGQYTVQLAENIVS